MKYGCANTEPIWGVELDAISMEPIGEIILKKNLMKKQCFNPILPSYEYIPDVEPYVFGDRLYIFGSHDRFDGEDFCMNDYVCWSAPVNDLGNWHNEGEIYKAIQDPLNEDGTQHLFAPDVQQGVDGRYYLYYCLHMSPSVSVAVCDTPAGKYEFYGHVHYQDGILYGHKIPGSVFNFDPGVLFDNGHIYLYTGISHKQGMIRVMMEKSGYRLEGAYCVELEQDMLTLKGEPKLVVPGEVNAVGTGFEGHGFFEASSPRKIGNQYYLIYSSVKSHDLCYAVSEKPTEGFRYGGVIVSIGDIGIVDESEAVNYLGNTHGGLVQVQNQWYIFYHRHTNCHRNSRQTCGEPIEILADGSIPQVEVTSCGLNGGSLSGTGEYEAYIACNLSGTEGTFEYQKEKNIDYTLPYFTQSGSDREKDGDQYIKNINSGAWMAYKYFVFSNEEKVTVLVRGNAEGILHVSTNKGGNPIAQINLHPSEDWSSFESKFQPPVGGKHALYFEYRGCGRLDFKGFKTE